jgi:hypothetical protein
VAQSLTATFSGALNPHLKNLRLTEKLQKVEFLHTLSQLLMFTTVSMVQLLKPGN